MGIRTLEGTYDGGETRAVLIDSTSGTAFGPLFQDAEEVEAFLVFLTTAGFPDPRTLGDSALKDAVTRFRTAEAMPNVGKAERGVEVSRLEIASDIGACVIARLTPGLERLLYETPHDGQTRLVSYINPYFGGRDQRYVKLVLRSGAHGTILLRTTLKTGYYGRANLLRDTYVATDDHPLSLYASIDDDGDHARTGADVETTFTIRWEVRDDSADTPRCFACHETVCACPKETQ